MSDELANEALHYAREWIHNNTHLVPEWLIAKVMNEAYPRGFVGFLVDYKFINRGEAA